MREIRNSDIAYLQMDNARYHWIIEALEFYKDNNIKVIDWPSYLPDLNPIQNVWGKMKKIKIKFLTITFWKWVI